MQNYVVGMLILWTASNGGGIPSDSFLFLDNSPFTFLDSTFFEFLGL